jgi:hypothetical protein
MGVRSITAHAEDGRWSWHLQGDQQPFERVERSFDLVFGLVLD